VAARGFRGSSSHDASAYKRSGHANEDSFGSLIGGTKEGLPAQGKTDWKADDGRTFSVKRGFSPTSRKWAKHWQVFLYGINRIKTDEGFVSLGVAGKLLIDSLEAFPPNFEEYEADKAIVKATLNSLPSGLKGAARLEEVRRRVSVSNTYLNSKDRLAEVNHRLALELNGEQALRDFLKKALFNGDEVQYLAVENGSSFDIFPRELVVDVLAKTLTPQVSAAGARNDDLNIAGQKVIMKHGTNVIELEVRNETNHYRELRFNMTAKKAHSILVANASIDRECQGLRWFQECKPSKQV
jgi:hypothetical protein